MINTTCTLLLTPGSLLLFMNDSADFQAVVGFSLIPSLSLSRLD